MSDAAEKTAHEWRVRFKTPDGFFTFIDIKLNSGLPLTKVAALAWGQQQLRLKPESYASVAHVYSIDKEDGQG